MSIPSTSEPAAMQWLVRNPPIKPAAPVIITFKVVDLCARQTHPVRHSPKSLAPGGIAQGFRYPHRYRYDGKSEYSFLWLAIAEIAPLQARRAGWAASRTRVSCPPYKFPRSRTRSEERRVGK